MTQIVKHFNGSSPAAIDWLYTLIQNVGDTLGSDGDKGDITVGGTGTTLTIDNDAVTYAKMQNVSAASKLLGRGSAGGAGDPEEITLGSGLTMTGTSLSAAGGPGGDSSMARTFAFMGA